MVPYGSFLTFSIIFQLIWENSLRLCPLSHDFDEITPLEARNVQEIHVKEKEAEGTNKKKKKQTTGKSRDNIGHYKGNRRTPVLRIAPAPVYSFLLAGVYDRRPFNKTKYILIWRARFMHHTPKHNHPSSFR